MTPHAALAALAVASIATAQTLDLSPPSESSFGHRDATLADLISAEPALGSSAELRRLSARLLRDPRAEHALLGRTLALSRDRIDTWLDGSPQAPGLVLLGINARGACAAALPEADGLDAWARRVLAPSWIGEPSPPSPAAVEAARALREMDMESAAQDVEALCGQGRTWMAHAAAADARAEGIVRGAAGWRSVRGSAPAARVDAPALDARFSAIVRGLLDPSAAVASEEAMERAATIGELVTIARGLGASREAADVASSLVSLAMQGDRHPALDRIQNMVRLVAASDRVMDDKLCVRQFRPAWRALTGAARPAAGRVLIAVNRLIDDPKLEMDPAILTAAAALRETMVRRATLLNATGVIESRLDELEPIADRMLRAAQDGASTQFDQSAREQAMLLLMDAARCVAWIGAMPGEEVLRTEHAGRVGQLTGRSAGDLQAVLDRARSAWIDGAKRQGLEQTRESGAHLEALHELLTLTRDGAWALAAAEAGMDAPCNRWSIVELSPEAMSALTGGLADRTREVANLVMQGAHAPAIEAAHQARQTHAGAMLLGRLARAASQDNTSLRTGSDVLWELTGAGLSEAERSWRAWARARLAEFCRAAEDVAMEAEGARSADLRETANRIARDLLAELVGREADADLRTVGVP